MELDLGGIETLDSPTSDDVRHYLRYMPAESPFVILSDGTGFIQAAHTGAEYRVEYCTGGTDWQYYCLVDYETACELFLAFHAGNTGYRSSVEWRQLKPRTIWNTPGHPVAVGIACVIGALIIVGIAWQVLQ